MLKQTIASLLRAILPEKRFRQLRSAYQSASAQGSLQNPLVPQYIYSSRINDEDVPWFEQQFYRNVDFFDAEVRHTEDRFNHALRMGYAFMASLRDNVRLMPGDEVAEKLVTLGNKGYDWTYFAEPIDEKASVYAFGVGTDISWEIAVARRHGCRVKCFDPTPQSIKYARSVAAKEPLIDFFPIGVSSADGDVDFFKPDEPGLGSHSMVNLRQSGTSIRVPVRKLSTLMKERGDKRIDLLKMDIEGAEYSVLENLADEIEIDQIAVEFDQPVPPWRTEKLIRKLLGAGYRVIHVDGLNCLFVHDRMFGKTNS